MLELNAERASAVSLVRANQKSLDELNLKVEEGTSSLRDLQAKLVSIAKGIEMARTQEKQVAAGYRASVAEKSRLEFQLSKLKSNESQLASDVKALEVRMGEAHAKPPTI